MKSHHKLYAAVLFLAVVLHYLAVFGLASKSGDAKAFFLSVVVMACSALVWLGSGLNRE